MQKWNYSNKKVYEYGAKMITLNECAGRNHVIKLYLKGKIKEAAQNITFFYLFNGVIPFYLRFIDHALMLINIIVK